MFKSTFPLLKKQQLTHDVYELTYAYNTEQIEITLENLPWAGQYVMFQLAPWLNRSYSIAYSDNLTFTLVIKRISDGRGSPIICDAEIHTSLPGIMSLGHFILQENDTSKCFIGTGTGFAPLYSQLLACKQRWLIETPKAFIFGVREFRDSFYESEIAELGESFSDFTHISYFSREQITSDNLFQKTGYVTDWITAENILKYQEFYLCGSPAMVKSVREKLEELGIQKEKVFFEQY